MSHQDFDRIHTKLDSIEVKLDDHLERLSKAENSIEWLKTHLKGISTIGLTIIISALGYVAKLFLRGES